MRVSDLTFFIYNSQFGQITIASNGKQITSVSLGAKKMSGTFTPTKLTNECSTQILQFLSGDRKRFNIPILLQGTEFEKEVWRGLFKTGYGCTVTPMQLAHLIGKDNTYRNIPKAAYANKHSILIPDHRLLPASKFEKPSQESKVRMALRKIESKFL